MKKMSNEIIFLVYIRAIFYTMMQHATVRDVPGRDSQRPPGRREYNIFSQLQIRQVTQCLRIQPRIFVLPDLVL